MFQPLHQLTPERRKGVILLVVITMLTLFAIIGLAFVLYSEAEAHSSRLYRESQTLPPVNTVSPITMLNYFLQNFIYPVPDPTTADQHGASIATRGHELARLMYG